jgi:hypothetical protein
MHSIEDQYAWLSGDLIEQGATTMNPITVFQAFACLAVGAGLGATGHLYAGIPVVDRRRDLSLTAVAARLALRS